MFTTKSLLKTTSFAALLATSLAGSPAVAADVFGKGSTKDSIELTRDATPTWTGFIVGGMFGGTFNSSELDFSETLDCPPIGLNVGVDGISTVGVHVGGVIGYQRQLGAFVAGVEGWGGWSNAESSAYAEITFGQQTEGGKVSVKQDYWYAGYGKLGMDVGGGVLVSGLLGYKQIHLEDGDALNGWDADIGGVSGGILLEKQFWNRISVGAYATYTAFEDKNFDGVRVDMDGYDVGLRATTRF